MAKSQCSRIIFSSLICGCLMHSFVEGAASRKVEEPSFSQVQANKVNIRQMEAGGVGYGQGYTTLEAFLTPTMTFDSWMPFADVRGHRFDNGLYAVNAGLGLRYLTPSNCTIWGANIYYDYRQTNRVNFKQIGIGLEALGAHWDYRINGYIPFGKRESGNYGAKFEKFKGNSLIINVKRKFDLGGFNAEAAYHWMPADNIEVTAALGPYYFQGKFNKFAAGGQARLKATFINAISIEGIASYDNLFKFNGQGQLAFSIPLGPKVKTKGVYYSDCYNQPALDLSLVRPVQRFEIIVADSHKQSKVAISSATGKPFHFIFVNNDPPIMQFGTFEQPYLTMAQAQEGSKPGDIIYVFGSDIVYGPATPGGNVITLQQDQQLLGSGISQFFSTTDGKIHALLATTYPMLSNGVAATDNIVTLANNNTVSGFNFPQVDVANGAAIHGDGISNPTIQNNTFNVVSTHMGQSTFDFLDCTGTITVQNNILSVSDANNDIAIFILPHSTTSGTYVIKNNVFFGNGNSGSEFVLYNPGGGASTSYVDNLSLIGNTISNWGTGADVTFNSGSNDSTSLLITGNHFSNLGTHGINYTDNSHSGITTVSGNTFNQVFTSSFTPGGKNLAFFDNNMFAGTTATNSFTFNALICCFELNNNVFDKSAHLIGPPTTPLKFTLKTPSGNTGPNPTLTNVAISQVCPNQ